MKSSILKIGFFLSLLFAVLFYSEWSIPSFDGITAAIGSLTNSSFSKDYSMAVWEWRSPDDFDNTGMIELVDHISKKGVDVVFLRIDKYIDIFESPYSTLRDEQLKQFENSLALFVSVAETEGIRVYGLAGHSTWSSESHRYIPQRLTTFVLEYNLRHPDNEKLAGIQFDIEPYTLAEYSPENAGRYLESFVVTVTDLVSIVDLSGQKDYFDLGFTIPYWYDTITPEGHAVTKENVQTSVFARISDTLAVLPSTHLAIMAYRNEASGNNGSINLVGDEFAYLAQSGYSSKIFIGQELSNITPASITFFSSKWRKFVLELNQIFSVYRRSTVFGGFVLNDMKTLNKLYP